MYVIGGLGKMAESQIQMYDPKTNLWAIGSAPVPYGNVGSVTAVVVVGPNSIIKFLPVLVSFYFKL